jgi:hypothetical protein
LSAFYGFQYEENYTDGYFLSASCGFVLQGAGKACTSEDSVKQHPSGAV